ncbi:hypothetical protein J7E79_00225 [Bacillus sp. ISL-40]|uniref:hypothetical protein n=1 Tax=unclassified Bacillus (in: firmicutes) TaxID=185979 RepID=UPI001BEBA6D9|nr:MULTISPECIES: hypothetical protein [unclassified Bacillus (in: firmicutes)]MBT2695873.1 hypothetical protein [Bacillus sp. ISL-40]MBT2739771.1 hypothetical protein [Bacillus sp. ISL-77]
MRLLRKYGWSCVLDGPDALAEARKLQYVGACSGIISSNEQLPSQLLKDIANWTILSAENAHLSDESFGESLYIHEKA